MMSKIEEKIKKIRENGENIYSISRLDAINNCLYSAYETYILKSKGIPNVYTGLGSRTHETLEKIVNGEATEADLEPAVDAELEDLDLLGLSFPKDYKGGDSIREGWIADMKHFCKTYKSPVGKNMKTEQQFLYQTPKGYYLQGFIDLQVIENDGSIEIYDYKTSSMYSAQDLKNHGRQLVLYQLGKEQEGYKVNQVAWIFLKYVTVSYNGYKTKKSKNKTPITAMIERRKIASTLRDDIIRDMEEAGYDSIEIDLYMNNFMKSNEFTDLPDDIASNYVMKPCVYRYPVTDEIKDECINYIETTIEKWESIDQSDSSNYPPRSFTKKNKFGKEVEDTFYCGCLCDHRKNCDHFSCYLETKKLPSDMDDLF